jgi:hypothetical protein
VKRDCFYKVKVTKDGKTETYRWGYFPWSMVLKDVKQLYNDGADAVVLEMITQEQFDDGLPKPY